MDVGRGGIKDFVIVRVTICGRSAAKGLADVSLVSRGVTGPGDVKSLDAKFVVGLNFR